MSQVFGYSRILPSTFFLSLNPSFLPLRRSLRLDRRQQQRRRKEPTPEKKEWDRQTAAAASAWIITPRGILNNVNSFSRSGSGKGLDRAGHRIEKEFQHRFQGHGIFFSLKRKWIERINSRLCSQPWPFLTVPILASGYITPNSVQFLMSKRSSLKSLRGHKCNWSSCVTECDS